MRSDTVDPDKWIQRCKALEDARIALGFRQYKAFAAEIKRVARPAPDRRQLSSVEKVEEDLTVEMWWAVLRAIVELGVDEEIASRLRDAVPPPPLDVPPARAIDWDSTQHRIFWDRWLEQVPSSSLHPTLLALASETDLDLDNLRLETLRRLRLDDPVLNTPDRVELCNGPLKFVAIAKTPIMVGLRLLNAGSAQWKDRLLFRLGAIATSGLPFSPKLVPVPDTGPGEVAVVTVPCLAQWQVGTAVVTYAMTLPSLRPSGCPEGWVSFEVSSSRGGRDRTDGLGPVVISYLEERRQES